MSDAIAQAIAAAQAEAENTPQTNLPATNDTAAAAGAAVPAVGGAARSLDDFLANAAMNVEFYLSVSEVGLFLGKDKKVHDEFLVEMNFKDAKFGYSLRFNGSSGVSYLTSWDGATEARSRQNWQATIAEVKKIDPASYVSDLVEIPVVLLQDYARKEGPVVKAGTVVGLSLNYMKAKAFGPFLKDQYPIRQKKPFQVKITAVSKVGGGQEYGVFGFEVVEPKAAGKK